jgi:hypothetical protein
MMADQKPVTVTGNFTTETLPAAAFDDLLRPNDGWCRVRTVRDTTAFGVWINPLSRAIVHFVSPHFGTFITDDEVTFTDTVKRILVEYGHTSDMPRILARTEATATVLTKIGLGNWTVLVDQWAYSDSATINP